MAATTDIGVGRNFLFRTTGRYFNTIKLAYLDRKEKGKDKTSDDIQCMIQNFQASDEIKFTTLSDVPVSKLHNFDTSKTNAETLTISTTKDHAGSIINKSIEDDPLLAPISENAKKERVCKKMLAAQYLFISIAWLFLLAFWFFMLCPEVIWCDVTYHSNNKGFNLLTFSCRTSVDKQVIFLWFWIPNEQRISFRWVFQHAIPILIPKCLRERVKFIMKDGDPQQRNEVIYALQSVFPNAIEGGCGWHICKYPAQ